MTRRLVGLKVVVEVQEGMEEDLVTLRGIVTMSLKGTEGDDSTVVHLDHPARWGRATGPSAGLPEQTLENLVIWPAFQGDSMERLLRRFGWNAVPCRIGSLTVEPRDGMTIGKSDVAYFSRGAVKRAQCRSCNSHSWETVRPDTEVRASRTVQARKILAPTGVNAKVVHAHTHTKIQSFNS